MQSLEVRQSIPEHRNKQDLLSQINADRNAKEMFDELRGLAAAARTAVVIDDQELLRLIQVRLNAGKNLEYAVAAVLELFEKKHVKSTEIPENERESLLRDMYRYERALKEGRVSNLPKLMAGYQTIMTQQNIGIENVAHIQAEMQTDLTTIINLTNTWKGHKHELSRDPEFGMFIAKTLHDLSGYANAAALVAGELMTLPALSEQDKTSIMQNVKDTYQSWTRASLVLEDLIATLKPLLQRTIDPIVSTENWQIESSERQPFSSVDISCLLDVLPAENVSVQVGGTMVRREGVGEYLATQTAPLGDVMNSGEMLYGHAGAYGNAILNIFRNAVREAILMGEEGKNTVHVGVRREENNLVVSISDQGRGLPPEVFDMKNPSSIFAEGISGSGSTGFGLADMPKHLISAGAEKFTFASTTKPGGKLVGIDVWPANEEDEAITKGIAQRGIVRDNTNNVKTLVEIHIPIVQNQ